jgi:hypothetical protein
MMSGWPKISKLAHAFLWEHSYERLQLAQFLGQRVCLTWSMGSVYDSSVPMSVRTLAVLTKLVTQAVIGSTSVASVSLMIARP